MRGFQFVSDISIDQKKFTHERKRENAILKKQRTFSTFSGEDLKTRGYNLKRR
jgi:hypothetical protein